MRKTIAWAVLATTLWAAPAPEAPEVLYAVTHQPGPTWRKDLKFVDQPGQLGVAEGLVLRWGRRVVAVDVNDHRSAPGRRRSGPCGPVARACD